MNVGFYVDVVRGKSFRLLAGPYAQEEQARYFLDHYRKRAIDYDSKCVFDMFGTCKVETLATLPKGIFTP